MKLTISKNKSFQKLGQQQYISINKNINNIAPMTKVGNNVPIINAPHNNHSNSLKLKCCSDNQSQRHVLIRPHSKEEKLIFDMVKIDCTYLYSKIKIFNQEKTNVLLDTIMKCINVLKVRYQHWIGYLCVHCCWHFQNNAERIFKVYKFVEKYRIAFEDLRCSSKILQQTINRMNLYCNDQQTTIKLSASTMSQIAKKYQQSLLLEFIPIQYSKYIIQRYLSQQGDIEQYVRLCVSVMHFVRNTCHPVNQGHFFNLMFRPYMGVVQWPIVIANRYMFQAQPTNSPLYREN